MDGCAVGAKANGLHDRISQRAVMKHALYERVHKAELIGVLLIVHRTCRVLCISFCKQIRVLSGVSRIDDMGVQRTEREGMMEVAR